MKTSHILTITCFALLLGTSGCIDVKNHYVLNPDGSGKVMHEATLQPMSFLDDGSDPDATGRSAVKQLVEDSSGIDAWSDVSFQVNDDGTITLQGTGYFPDVNTVQINSGGMTSESKDFVLQSTPGGPSRLAFYDDQNSAAAEDAGAELTDAELEAQLKSAKGQYNQSKPMMAAMLGSMRMEHSFDLPGDVTKSSNVTMDGNKATLVFDGAKVLSAMDAIYADDAWLTELVKAGKDPMADRDAIIGNRFNEKVFGTAGPIKVEFNPGATPQFDYAAEVAAAQNGLEAMLAGMGIQAPVPIQAAPGGGFKSVMVGGVQWIRYADQENGIQPLNGQEGYKIAVVADLGGAALSVGEGEVTEAIADNGETLLPDSDWHRKINFPRLSENGDKVVFEIPLSAPGNGVTGIQKVAGHLTYTVGSTTKDVDLGFTGLTAGRKGTEYNAALEKVQKSQWSDGYEISLKLDVQQSTVKEVKFLDAAGKALSVEPAGHSSWGDAVEFSFSSATALPDVGKIIAVVYDDMVEYKADFALENLDLVGNPR